MTEDRLYINNRKSQKEKVVWMPIEQEKLTKINNKNTIIKQRLQTENEDRLLSNTTKIWRVTCRSPK